MANRTLAGADRDNRRLSVELMDRLLARENDAAAKVDAWFAATSVDLPDRLDDIGSGRKRKVMDAYDRACDKCRDQMKRLVEAAQKAGLDTAKEQMSNLDDARPKSKQYGTEAHKAVADDPLDMDDYWRRVLDAAIHEARTDFRKGWAHQRGQAADGGELSRRIWSPDPVSLKGLSGRGIVWRTASAAKMELRHASVNVANAVVDDVLLAYNWLDDNR